MTNFIPIFPLNIVVYPGEALNLHIFEPRYKQMIRECLDEKKPFGLPPVVEHVPHDDYGTLVEIEELVQTHPDGTMDIRTRGKSVFRILHRIDSIPDKLYAGAIVNYPENTTAPGDSHTSRAIVSEVKRMCARFVASLSMILFGLNALWDVHPRRWLRERWWLFGLLWVVCFALSGFWSSDGEEWFAHLQVKFPFLFLPLAFAFIPPFTPRQLRIFTWCLAGMMCAGAAYSASFLWHGQGDLVDSYKYAHVLPTPVYDDHIAFSALVAVSIGWMMFYAPHIPGMGERRLLYGLAFLLAVYLHVLAAKTGLVALYILLIGLIVFQLRRSRRTGLVLLLSTGAMAASAYLLFPTLRERIGYSIVTWRSYVMGERSGIYSDAGRLISYDLALHSIAEHPLAGVGAGDVFHEMKAGYARAYPEVPPAQQLWPHNEFLTIAMAAGIPTALLFLLWILAPLRLVRRNRAGFYFVLIWLMLLVPLTVDLFLEVQFGVAVYLIFLLWQRSFLLYPPSEAAAIPEQT